MKKRKLWIKCVAVVAAGMLLTACENKQAEVSVATQSEEVSGIAAMIPAASSEELQKESTPEAPKDDWSNKYATYFEEHPLDNKVMDVETEEAGMRIHLRFSFGHTDEMVYVKYVVWEGKAKKSFDLTDESNCVTLYYFKNGDAYIETAMKGKKTEYQKATGMSWEEALENTKTDTPMGIDDDMFESLAYDREETVDGVIYDVLSSKALRKTKSKANRWVKYYFYVNRATQELERCQMVDVTDVMECTFVPLDMEAISQLPEEYNSAKKMKAEEFVLRYALAIVKITYNSVGIDPDQLNLEASMGLKK